MMTLILGILLLLGIGFLLKRNTRVSIIIFLTAFFYYLLVGCGFIPTIMLSGLQTTNVTSTQETWKKHNVIVLLGAGTIKSSKLNAIEPTILAYPRMQQALKLYFDCKKSQQKCTLIISGGDARALGRSEAEVYRDQLIGLGANSADILLESHSMNTFQNALYTKQILKKLTFDKIILVTSDIHLKRSLLYFAHFNIHPQPVASEHLQSLITPLPTGYNFAISDMVTHEYLGIARFHFYNFMGWNKTSPT